MCIESMDKPRIKVDFNERMEPDLVLISKTDVRTDSDGNSIKLFSGAFVYLYEYNKYEDGEEELRELLGGKGLMSFPKPRKLIEKLCVSLQDKNCIIMDFFAGSGTTGQAVMHLNSLDGGSRAFINVQLAENTAKGTEANKAGYNTVFEITKARLTNSAKNIRVDNSEYNGDLGFKIYETVDDFRISTDEELNVSTQVDLFKDVELTPEQYHTLLTTWSLNDGSLLATSIESINLADYPAHYCEGRLYLIAPSFSIAALKALLTKLDEDKAFSPHKVVFYGNNFDSKNQRELNEALKSYANKKSLELDVVVRY